MKDIKVMLSALFAFVAIGLGAFMYSRGPVVAQREWSQKTAVVFDLGGVLFDTDKKTVMKQLGKSAARYAISHLTFSGSTFKKQWFKVLEQAAEWNDHTFAVLDEGGDPVVVTDEYGSVLPSYMVEWLSGGRPNQEIFDDVSAAITALPNLSESDKEFMIRMSRVFLADTFVASRKVNNEMIELLEKLKEKGYPLYVLSNWDSESFQEMLQAYPEIFNYFDGYIVSGHVKLLKPDLAIYAKLEQTFAHEGYIFLDDQKDNRVSARLNGWKTVKISRGNQNIGRIYRKIKKRRDLLLQERIAAVV